MAGLDVQSIFYSYAERLRTLLSAETWQRLALDLSKNDLLALLFLHRRGASRMSDVAEYLGVPLNTATGVVSRLQGRGLVERRNSKDDKRVVVVSLSPAGHEQISHGLREAMALANRVVGDLSGEQIQLLVATFDRVLELLSEYEQSRTVPRRKTRRIAID